MLLTAGRTGHSSGSRRRNTRTSRNHSRSTRCDCITTRSQRGQLNPTPDAEAATPVTPPTAPREEDPARFKKNLARSCTADGIAAIVAPPVGGTTTAGAPETAGAWETVTVSTRSCRSRLAAVLSPLTANGQREEIVRGTASGHENDEGDRLTANGHDNLPGEQGIANAADVIGSGQKTANGHAESGLGPRIETGLPESESERDGSGSDPKIATDHVATVHGRTATEKTTASDTLDHSTANGKRSENENDGHGHESCPIENRLYDPSLVLDPKIGKHGRIENGSGPPKPLSTHHVAERAATSGEKQPRKRSGQGESAATEQPPSLLARNQRISRDTSTPLAGPTSSGRGGSLTGRNTRCTPRPPPLSSCPHEWQEEKEEEVPGRGSSRAGRSPRRRGNRA